MDYWKSHSYKFQLRPNVWINMDEKKILRGRVRKSFNSDDLFQSNNPFPPPRLGIE